MAVCWLLDIATELILRYIIKAPAAALSHGSGHVSESAPSKALMPPQTPKQQQTATDGGAFAIDLVAAEAAIGDDSSPAAAGDEYAPLLRTTVLVILALTAHNLPEGLATFVGCARAAHRLHAARGMLRLRMMHHTLALRTSAACLAATWPHPSWASPSHSPSPSTTSLVCARACDMRYCKLFAAEMAALTSLLPCHDLRMHAAAEGVAIGVPVFFATGSRWRAVAWAGVSGVAEPLGAAIGLAVYKSGHLDPLAMGM